MKEVSLLKLLKKKSKLYEDLDQIMYDLYYTGYIDSNHQNVLLSDKDSCFKKIEKLNKKLKPLLIKELESLK